MPDFEAEPDEIKGKVEFTAPHEVKDPIEPHQPKGTPTLASTVKITGDAADLLRSPVLGVNLRRTRAEPTLDQGLWIAIRNRTDAVQFKRYQDFLDRLLCNPPAGPAPSGLQGEVVERVRDLPAHSFGVHSYHLLKFATEAFLLLANGLAIDDTYDKLEEDTRLDRMVGRPEAERLLRQYLGDGVLPYLKLILSAIGFGDQNLDNPSAPFCRESRVQRDATSSMIELIWSYWHEEGMLVQTINAICLRFQNKRGPGRRDPLANLELDPLRPVNNLIWGYIQDEYNRLTVQRRAFEYAHHYGLTLVGRAVPGPRPADIRSRFLEAFHDLLLRTSRFYLEDADTTVISNAFPLLNGLKEVHLILAEGAHNQFGDLPWAARVEMLIQEYILARPEMREFLGGRIMVPYQEAWMGRVDTMKTLQGWSDVPVTHFRNLGVYGEQIILSIRYGDWIEVNDQDQARNWARYWRPEIEGYLHAYRAVTGVDLTSADSVDARQPSALLARRLPTQVRGIRALGPESVPGAPALPPGAVEPAPLPAPSRDGAFEYRRPR
jgi:hypothetical protein